MRLDRRRQPFALASALLAGAALVMPRMEARQNQAKVLPLETAAGIRVNNLKITPATLDGKKGVQLTSTGVEEVALIEGVEFDNGVIEAELAGTPGPGAGEGARGFVGIAFRVQKDMQAYDAFYLRPTNGRADDQERRNHVTQYISHPEWTWSRLRKETPSRYESYVDMVPNTWTRIKIDVSGARASLYVHDQPQPVLIVNDVKTGPQGRGGVGLWVGSGTVAHFRNVRVSPAGGKAGTPVPD